MLLTDTHMEEVEIFQPEALARTCIRAQDAEGKWGSFSLRELLDLGLDKEIIKWFGARMADAAGIPPDGKLTDDAAANICRIIECIQGPLVKIKPDAGLQP
jgi:hypothetical protein